MNNIERKLLTTYHFFNENWNAILAGIAVLGIAIFEITPQLQVYRDFFIFLGLNAVVWTLVEIKINLISKNRLNSYKDMREARPYILETLRREISRSGNAPLHIRIVAGRLRTMSDLIREIVLDIERRQLSAKDLTITLYGLDPDFLKSWGLPETSLRKESLSRNENYAGIVARLKEELLSYNELDSFRANNVRIEVKFYKEAPFAYFYLIGSTDLFWGHFTWNSETEDFEGPINSCYYLRRTDANFFEIYHWLSSRLSFLDTTGN